MFKFKTNKIIAENVVGPYQTVVAQPVTYVEYDNNNIEVTVGRTGNFSLFSDTGTVTESIYFRGNRVDFFNTTPSSLSLKADHVNMTDNIAANSFTSVGAFEAASVARLTEAVANNLNEV